MEMNLNQWKFVETVNRFWKSMEIDLIYEIHTYENYDQLLNENIPNVKLQFSNYYLVLTYNFSANIDIILLFPLLLHILLISVIHFH